jgi:outer membrane scaffolding protein for murein synthesis (MipA/OmpV family)
MALLKSIFITAVASILIASSANAEQVPQWEIGAGAAYIDFPDYRGSNERETYVLPIPYGIYHGDILKVDHQRVRGLLFHTEAVELDVSVNGSVPVRNNAARQGMPDLDPTLEIGPVLNISLYKSESNHAQLELRLPVRSVIATDFTYLRDVGFMFQPQLNLDVKNVFDQTGWNLGMGAGPIFTDRRYNQYFYGVDASYARPDRPAYTASGGFAGSQFVAALTKRFPSYWVSGFVKWDMLQGAAFEGSPLVKTKDSATSGFAVSWVFAESSIKVDEDN